MIDVWVSTFPFAREDETPLRELAAAGASFAVNPAGRKMRPEELAEIAGESRVVVAGTEDLRPLIESSRRLGLIARVGIGLDSVPLELCRSRGIRVAYTPDAVTPAVAELTIGLMLDATRHVTRADRELRRGDWTRPYGRRLGRSKVGLVGFGRIGTAVARLLVPFAPREILVHDIRDCSEKIGALRDSGVALRQVELIELLRESDVVSLHVPLTGRTRGMIDRTTLRHMKASAVLLNTARGGVVDEGGLYQALKEGVIAAAAIDVFEHEPYRGELAELDNVVLTQHMASCANDCRARMELEAVRDAIRFLKGERLAGEVPEEEYEYQKE